jgi:hypothetical protein
MAAFGVEERAEPSLLRVNQSALPAPAALSSSSPTERANRTCQQNVPTGRANEMADPWHLPVVDAGGGC